MTFANYAIYVFSTAGYIPDYPSESASSPSPASIGSWQSPHTSEVCGFAHAFTPQAGQVYFVLLADFFLRFAASPSLHNST
jgi:hypothetical protein